MTSHPEQPPNKHQHLHAVLIYFSNLYIFSPLGLIVSVVYLIFQKKNIFIRFHAMQALLVFGGLFILDLAFFYTPSIGRLLNAVLIIADLVLWVFLMIKAYQGHMYKLPYIGNLAEQLLKKVG